MGETSQRAVDTLKEQDLDFFPAPTTDLPALPDDITELDEQQLMALFTRLTVWSDYVTAQAAVAAVDERDTERALDYAEALAVTGAWGGTSGDRVSITKAKVALDPAVIRLRQEHSDRYAYRKLIDTLAANVERDSALISRELTRRTSGQTAVVRRSNRWTT
jgi:ribosomal protein L12E/L44/L45/RPP1/RPP2